MPSKSLSFICALALLGTAHAQQGDSYSISEFKSLNDNKIGRPKKDNVIELDFSPGIVNQVKVGSLNYARNVGNGLGEVVLSLSGTQFSLPDPVDSSMHTANFKMGGLGLKYRSFWNNIEEGGFAGGGLKVFHWIWDYGKYSIAKPQNSVQFQTFSPFFEIGYIHKLSPATSWIASTELGGALHTIDPLELGNEKKHTPFTQEGNLKYAYYTLNFGFRFAF